MRKTNSTITASQKFWTFALVLLVASQPNIAFAQANAFGPIQTALQMIIDFVTGPFGRSVAVIAVIGLGLLALAGRISWMACGMVVIGIGLVFGAPAIVDQMISSVGS